MFLIAHDLSVVIPAKAGTRGLCFSENAQLLHESHWVPAFAGMTVEGLSATGDVA
jgi:hypothetical protein